MMNFKRFWLLHEDNKEHMIGKIMQHYNVDAQQAKNVLQQWMRIKEKAKIEHPNKGILSWSSIESLQQMMNDLLETPEFKKHEKEFNRVAMQHGAEKVFENDECIIYLVHNKWASILLGKGTKWCIAATENNAWEDYTNPDDDAEDAARSIFFFLIDKQNKVMMTNKQHEQLMVPVKWAIQCKDDDDVAIWDNMDADHGAEELQHLKKQYHLPDDFEAEYLHFRKLKPMTELQQQMMIPHVAYTKALRQGHAIAALEPIIAMDLHIAAVYAVHVRKKRFKQIEPRLILALDWKGTRDAFWYMETFFKDEPWPEYFALKSKQCIEWLQQDNTMRATNVLSDLLKYSIKQNDAQMEFYLNVLKHHAKALTCNLRYDAHMYNVHNMWAEYNKKYPMMNKQAQDVVNQLLVNDALPDNDGYLVAANHAMAMNKRNEMMENKIKQQGGIVWMDALSDYAKRFNLHFKPNMKHKTLPNGQTMMLFHFVNK